ncbi:MAG: hypothetical protein Alpg2KO_06620 [Alphaproteobacteria bacterium]
MSDAPVNDFPFDVILGNNGDMSIALPARHPEPQPDFATLRKHPDGVVLTRRQGEEIELYMDEETSAQLLSLDSVVIAETDAEEQDIRYLYAANVVNAVN